MPPVPHWARPSVALGRARAPSFCWRRGLHASSPRRREAADHYARLGVRRDASPGEIKKSFYALSKVHHPDMNPSDPDAARSFALVSEAYGVLSDPARRASYDRDVLRLERHQGLARRAHASYSSTAAGGRAPSGLSRRRGSFRGPAPSFYRNGGWGAHGDARRHAHEESTGTSFDGGHGHGPGGKGPGGMGSASTGPGGMGPGSASPFGRANAPVPPHFDHDAHVRTHQTEDRRRWERSRRAVGDDDIEFEPQTSLAAHFLIVAGILGAAFLAPVIYLRVVRLARREREPG